MSNEMIKALSECQFHNNCGGWCETSREVEHNLCTDCLEAHDEDVRAKPEPVTDEGDTVQMELKLLDFALSFALCNRDHGGTRRDVKKAQEHLEKLRALLAKPAEQPRGEPVYLVRTHGSCCWEEVASGSLEDFQSMPEEYELRALYTCPAELYEPVGSTSDKYKAELYDEVWQLARGMGYGNVTDALMKLQGNKP